MNLSPQHMDNVVLGLFQGEGEIFATRRLADPTIFRALVEFSDIDDAIAAINKFNGCTYGVSATPPPKQALTFVN